jgi:hypothetical protein
MPLVINDPETIARLRELAQRTGEDEQQVLRQAVRAYHPAIVEDDDDPEVLYRDILKIARRSAALLTEPARSAEHNDLYGDDGLPA